MTRALLAALLLLGCGGDDGDDEPEADAATPDAAPQPVDCDPQGDDCGEYELCLQGADLAFTCKVPMCDIAGAGMGPCCDLRAPDGGSARGVCVDGQCQNSRDRQASDRCAALTGPGA